MHTPGDTTALALTGPSSGFPLMDRIPARQLVAMLDKSVGGRAGSSGTPCLRAKTALQRRLFHCKDDGHGSKPLLRRRRTRRTQKAGEFRLLEGWALKEGPDLFQRAFALPVKFFEQERGNA